MDFVALALGACTLNLLNIHELAIANLKVKQTGHKKLHCFIFLASFQWACDDLAAPISSCVCVISQGKIPGNSPRRLELNPGHGADRQ